MAGFCGRSNSKLDSFLKRNAERGVYERVRAYEPCVVRSERVRRPAYMHVVLSDERVYLAQYPPRTLTAAVHFGQVQHIQLVNDIPVFLSGRDREHCQHIRLVYTTAAKPAAKRDHWLRRGKGVRLPTAAAPTRNHQRSVPPTLEGVSSLLPDNRWRITPEPLQRGQRVLNVEEEDDDEDDDEDNDEGEVQRMPTMQRMLRSASCPNPETLGLRGGLPPSPLQPPLSPLLLLPSPSSSPRPLPHWSSKVPGLVQLSRRRGSALASLLKRPKVSGGQEETKGQGDGEVEAELTREAELHLYSVSKTSHIYLHLQSSWSSYIIRATLMLDPLYRRTCNIASSSSSHKQPPNISWERTCHLFSQLRGELIQENNSVESVFLLLQELHTAALRDLTLRTLFWRSSDLCVFLVQTLEGALHSRTDDSPRCVNTEDQLLLCTVVVQTLALMFRETEVEPSRHTMLTCKNGGLTSRMLLALVCDPHCCHNSALSAEYQDAACSLLFELVLLGQEVSRCSSVENFLTVGWILRVLQPHPHLHSFLDYQACQVVRVWSDGDHQGAPPLSPAQAVLLFQRCRVLVVCLQHGGPLAEHLKKSFREEFRYYVKGACLKERLLHHYPISQPAARLVTQLQALMLQT